MRGLEQGVHPQSFLECSSGIYLGHIIKGDAFDTCSKNIRAL